MSGPERTHAELLRELDVAEQKAWDSLARYKFTMYGYWAAIWVHLNRIGHCNRPNPWAGLVRSARGRTTSSPAEVTPLFDAHALSALGQSSAEPHPTNTTHTFVD
jgi:hypothetical protein